MRGCKLFDAEKIKKKRKDFLDFVDFSKPLYKRESLIYIKENIDDITILSEQEKLKSAS